MPDANYNGLDSKQKWKQTEKTNAKCKSELLYYCIHLQHIFIFKPCFVVVTVRVSFHLPSHLCSFLIFLFSFGWAQIMRFFLTGQGCTEKNSHTFLFFLRMFCAFLSQFYRNFIAFCHKWKPIWVIGKIAGCGLFAEFLGHSWLKCIQNTQNARVHWITRKLHFFSSICAFLTMVALLGAICTISCYITRCILIKDCAFSSLIPNLSAPKLLFGEWDRRKNI